MNGGEGSTPAQNSESGEVNSRLINDPLALSNSDHPGAQLVSSKFNGTNFLSWSRSVKMALGAKFKIGFIDGSLRQPAFGTPEYQMWIRSDYMVRCWILNSMSSSFSEGFVYVNSARQLWDEIAERFGQSNGPLVFQLRRELSSSVQDNLSVAEYYGKRKRIWDEIDSLEEIPQCSCGAMDRCSCTLLKRMLEMQNRNKLMEFLLGLNDGFETVRNQILSMEPLPSVNRAYYLAMQVERQKIVTGNQVESNALSVNRGRQQDYKGSDRNGAGPSKKGKVDKSDRKCSNCNMKGHLVDQCFKIIGYPEWYVENKLKDTTKDTKKSANANTVNSEIVNSPLENIHDFADPVMVNAVLKEVIRYMKKGKHVAEPEMSQFSGP